MNEFEIIRRYFARGDADPDVLIGVGDDAAVLRADGRIVVTVDALVEGVHFLAGTDANAVGHRALAVNLSDVAAMGARPRWCTLALTLPDVDPEWLEGFAAGFHALAEACGVSLVGGNIARGALTITVEVIGTLGPGREPLTRGGARPGDDVYVTGTLGDGAGGLAVLSERGAVPADAGEDEISRRAAAPRSGAPSGPSLGAPHPPPHGAPHRPPHRAAPRPEAPEDARAALVERFLRPTPRVDAGLALGGIASAAIDLSDGLAADLGHLCAASGCGAVVDVDSLPRSAPLESVFAPEDALALALSGGDDYELCFTAAAADAKRVDAALVSARTPARRVGRIVAGEGIEWRRGRERLDPAGGYRHF